MSMSSTLPLPTSGAETGQSTGNSAPPSAHPAPDALCEPCLPVDTSKTGCGLGDSHITKASVFSPGDPGLEASPKAVDTIPFTQSPLQEETTVTDGLPGPDTVSLSTSRPELGGSALEDGPSSESCTTQGFAFKNLEGGDGSRQSKVLFTFSISTLEKPTVGSMVCMDASSPKASQPISKDSGSCNTFRDPKVGIPTLGGGPFTDVSTPKAAHLAIKDSTSGDDSHDSSVPVPSFGMPAVAGSLQTDVSTPSSMLPALEDTKDGEDSHDPKLLFKFSTASSEKPEARSSAITAVSANKTSRLSPMESRTGNASHGPMSFFQFSTPSSEKPAVVGGLFMVVPTPKTSFPASMDSESVNDCHGPSSVPKFSIPSSETPTVRCDSFADVSKPKTLSPDLRESETRDCSPDPAIVFTPSTPSSGLPWVGGNPSMDIFTPQTSPVTVGSPATSSNSSSPVTGFYAPTTNPSSPQYSVGGNSFRDPEDSKSPMPSPEDSEAEGSSVADVDTSQSPQLSDGESWEGETSAAVHSSQVYRKDVLRMQEQIRHKDGIIARLEEEKNLLARKVDGLESMSRKWGELRSLMRRLEKKKQQLSGDVEKQQARMQQLTSEMEELKETSESKISRLTEERDAARDDHERLTSEEDWTALFAQRAMVYRLDSGRWTERCTGQLKIMKHTSQLLFRVLMRRQQVLKVVCNHLITTSMKLKPMASCQSIWCWVASDYADNYPRVEQFAVKFQKMEAAKEFKAIFERCQEKLRQGCLSLLCPVIKHQAGETEESVPETTVSVSLQSSSGDHGNVHHSQVLSTSNQDNRNASFRSVMG